MSLSSSSSRRCLALLLAPALLAQAPDRSDWAARLATLEKIMDRFYRGESQEAARQRVNAMVDACNAQTEQLTREAEAARAQADQALAPARAAAAQLQARDQELGAPPDRSDQAAVRRYNDRVDARNMLATRVNELQAQARSTVTACNAVTRRIEADLARARDQATAATLAVNARGEDYAAFRAADRDMAFFGQVNRLLADLRLALRRQEDPALAGALAKVRGLRRELANWAAAREAAQSNGLVLVLALVDDEPCCFIVDTGAQQVCLPPEIIDALALTASLGQESDLILAGGQKVRGRPITLPRVAASGHAATGIAGMVIPPSEVGVDGLLGQSFLKHFLYTIDTRQSSPLILVPK